MRIDDGLRLVRPPADHEASDDSSQHLLHRPNARTMYERSLNRNLKRESLAGSDAVRHPETAQIPVLAPGSSRRDAYHSLERRGGGIGLRIL